MRSVLRRDREGWTPAFIAVILLIIASFFASLFAPPVVSIALGVTVSLSPDQKNWTLTFVSVPTGIPQNATTLSLYASTGLPLLNATSMFQLEGSGVNGVVYRPYQTGPAYTNCGPGDQIWALVSQYPSGSQWSIAYSGRILSSGTLQ